MRRVDDNQTRSEAASTGRPTRTIRRQGGSRDRRYQVRATASGTLSAEATGWVWNCSPYTLATLLVHLAIADVVNDANGNEFWMTVERLARKARVGRSSTVAALTVLRDDGFIEVTQPGGGRGIATRYRFLMPPVDKANLSDREPFDPGEKPSTLRGETVQNPARRDNSMNTRTQGEESKSTVDNAARPPDEACVSCRGTGVRYNAIGGFDERCACTAPDYTPAPTKATRPVVGFGMPKDRR